MPSTARAAALLDDHAGFAPKVHDAIRATDHAMGARTSNATFNRSYVVPSYATAQPGEAEAIELLANILGGRAGRLADRLVGADAAVKSSNASYDGNAIGSGTILLRAQATGGDLELIEAGVDAVLDDIRKSGVTEVELERARTSVMAPYIYSAHEASKLAMRYGRALAIGQTIEQVEARPAAIAKVTVDDIKRVANEYLDPARAVTGWLVPDAGDVTQGAQLAKAV
jgi:zinc protease